jgi:hypothetical protein
METARNAVRSSPASVSLESKLTRLCECSRMSLDALAHQPLMSHGPLTRCSRSRMRSAWEKGALSLEGRRRVSKPEEAAHADTD